MHFAVPGSTLSPLGPAVPPPQNLGGGDGGAATALFVVRTVLHVCLVQYYMFTMLLPVESTLHCCYLSLSTVTVRILIGSDRFHIGSKQVVQPPVVAEG